MGIGDWLAAGKFFEFLWAHKLKFVRAVGRYYKGGEINKMVMCKKFKSKKVMTGKDLMKLGRKLNLVKKLSKVDSGKALKEIDDAFNDMNNVEFVK